MEKHVRILGILHIVYSSLALLFGFLIFILLSGIGLAVAQAPEVSDMDVSVPSILAGIGFIVAVVLTVLSLPGIIGGIGLMKYKEWARILVIIVGFFDLLHIPVGTALGIYTIWALFNAETIKLFSPPLPASPAPAATPAPPAPAP